MKRYLSIEKQRGTSLIEASVALLMIGLVSQGAVFLTTRATATQSDLYLLEVVVNQMRSALIENEDICTTAPVIMLPNNISLTADVRGCGVTTAKIGLVDIDGIPEPIVLSVTSDLLGGQVVVGGTWN